MNIAEKRDFIHNHLHQVNEPAIDDIYVKMMSLVKESLLEESEEDIKNNNLVSHKIFKQEVLNWRPVK